MAHANQGGLFLDDVAEFPPSVQPKILQAVEDGVFFSVGSDRPSFIRGDRPLKIYAASQPDVMHKLRPDLRDRLCTLTLTIPPLRERGPDILLLADHELEVLNRVNGRTKRLTRAGRSILLLYMWPGNVRQLRNVIARSYILSGDTTALEPDALAEALEEEERLEAWSTGDDAPSASTWGGEVPFPTLRELETSHITRAVRLTGGNITHAARVLGISRSTLQSKLRRIEPKAT